MKNYKEKLAGFTLAEAAIILFVIGVVVTASLGIYKTQLNTAKRYEYYAAFENLKMAIGEIIVDGSWATNLTSPTNLLPDAGNRINASSPLQEGLCQRLSEVINTLGDPVCTRTSTVAGPFTVGTANFITSNGVRYFNLGSNPTIVDPPDPYKDYYKIYVDIDGSAGKSITGLYSAGVDVVPFKIYRSGQVVPGLDSSGLGPNMNYMKASVKYNTGATDVWPSAANGVPYLQAACYAGVVTAPDCPAEQSVTAPCDTIDCDIVITKP